MQKGPVTPKGFNDIFPEVEKRKRTYINSISLVLEKYGFEPLETPIVEFAETLLGKYGKAKKESFPLNLWPKNLIPKTAA